MSVPVRNAFYLYCYADELFAAGHAAAAGADDFPDGADFLVRILTSQVSRILARGADRGYVPAPADLRSPRGKLRIADTLKRGLFARNLLSCEPDDRTPDVPHNRFLKAVLVRAAGTSDVAPKLRAAAANLAARLADVADVPANPAGVRLHANLRHYALAVAVGRMLVAGTIPAPGGGHTFADPMGAETHAAKVFEAFVRNFYRREQSHFPTVGSRRFAWKRAEADAASTAFLPEMRTDVTLESSTRTLVIDAKYYSAAVTGYFDAKTLHAANLYQLFAYLANLAVDAVPGREPEGLLLYPATGVELNLAYTLHGHRLRVATVDLDRPWPEIHGRMLKIIE